MQEPCRHPIPGLRTPPRAALLLALALAGAPAGATAPLTLKEGAIAWAAAQTGIAPDLLKLAPMDSRVEITPCATGWSFDYPFASRETLRARCAEPRNHYFLRLVGLPRAGPVTSAAAGAAAPTAGAPTAGTPPAAGTAATSAGAPRAPEERPTAVVLVRDLPRGARLTPELVSTMATDPQRLDPRSLRDPKEVLHAELVRDLRAGQPLRISDLKAVTLVRRGQMVTYNVGEPSSYRITARLEALQDGVHGDRIRLRNPESGRIVTGRVTAENTVEFN
jgi:flagella basal body P-ring formation protein FlgA